MPIDRNGGYDDHAGHVRLDLRDDLRDGRSLIEGRNEGDDRHASPLARSAGSTSTDAATSVTTETADTTPIDCSGG